MNEDLQQYAAFRLFYISLLADNQDITSYWASVLQQNHPDSSLINIAQILSNASDTNTIVETCRTETRQLVESGIDFETLLDLGYATYLGYLSLCQQ